MQTIRKLILDLRGTRLHNITKHLTEILTRLTAKVDALTLTEAQSAELTALEESVKASIVKADAAIEAQDYAEVKVQVTAAKTDLLAIIEKIHDIKEASSADSEQGE